MSSAIFPRALDGLLTVSTEASKRSDDGEVSRGNRFSDAASRRRRATCSLVPWLLSRPSHSPFFAPVPRQTLQQPQLHLYSLPTPSSIALPVVGALPTPVKTRLSTYNLHLHQLNYANMGDLDISDGLPNLNSLPVNPDAQDTVKDFLDYTEFYPSDLVRSLTLIGKLDKTYNDLTNEVHRLTRLYANLPRLRADHRPDPQAIRRQIATALDRATICRETASVEAKRLYKVTERHTSRLSIIKRKLQALPEPPSRDPTPPPISPQTARARRQEAERPPRLTLHVGRHLSSARAARAEKGHGRLSPPPASDQSDSDFDTGVGQFGDSGRRRKVIQKIKIPKQPRVRPPGVMGTNVHSSVAGISTSNALAKLTPPPPDAPPGSKYAPWFKLTEYEMALLRKQMKKNAIWVPSDVMIRRELARRGRGHENYLKAKEHAEATGEPFLDDDPQHSLHMESGTTAAASEPSTGEASKIPAKEDTSIINRGMKLNEAKKLKRTRELEEANRQMKETGDFMKTLFSSARTPVQPSFPFDKSLPGSTPTTERKRRDLERSRKRKRGDESAEDRNSTKDSPTSEDHGQTQEQVQDSPVPKRPRIVPPKSSTIPPPSLGSPASTIASVVAPGSATTVKTTTTQVPLAPPGPEGPSSPVSSAASSVPVEPELDGDAVAVTSPKEKKKPVIQTTNQASQSTAVTAAASRPRRESTAPIKEQEGTPEPIPQQKSPPATTAASSRPSRQVSSRPSSRAGTVSLAHSVKAASAEPPSKPERMGSRGASVRRASNASMPLSTTPVPGHQIGSDSGVASVRTRRKPAPGAVASDGDGKGKISRVPRHKGQKKGGGSVNGANGQGGGDGDGEIDPNEPRYCICNDVSYGEMIACDNKSCDGEWFHYGCVGIPEGTLPSRVAKWFCPQCRKMLKIDEHGNPSEALNISLDKIKKVVR